MLDQLIQDAAHRTARVMRFQPRQGRQAVLDLLGEPIFHPTSHPFAQGPVEMVGGQQVHAWLKHMRSCQQARHRRSFPPDSVVLLP